MHALHGNGSLFKPEDIDPDMVVDDKYGTFVVCQLPFRLSPRRLSPEPDKTAPPPPKPAFLAPTPREFHAPTRSDNSVFHAQSAPRVVFLARPPAPAARRRKAKRAGVTPSARASLLDKILARM